MSGVSIILFLLAVFYIVGTLFELPIMFEGNPKSRFLISKIGKRNLKIVTFVIGAILIVVAIVLK